MIRSKPLINIKSKVKKSKSCHVLPMVSQKKKTISKLMRDHEGHSRFVKGKNSTANLDFFQKQ